MITFETNCYEKNWKLMLKTNYLDDFISSATKNENIAKKILLINDVSKPELVRKYAEKKVRKGVIDKFFFIDEEIDTALKRLGLNKNSFKNENFDGILYSREHIVAIAICETEWLYHLSEDCTFEGGEWLGKAIKKIEINNDIISANPKWDVNLNSYSTGAVEEKDGYWITQGFSDQCYFIPVNMFRRDIYSYEHKDSDRYPQYGGECFEKKVDSFMRCNNKLRIIDKEVSYFHKGIPKNIIYLWWLYIFFHSPYVYLNTINMLDIKKKINLAKSCLFGKISLLKK